MFSFKSHYYDRKIYLEDGRSFQLGDILKKYLSISADDVSRLYNECLQAKYILKVLPDVEDYNIGRTAAHFEQVYEDVALLAQSFPPYDKMNFKPGILQNLFACHEFLFDPCDEKPDKDEPVIDDYDYEDENSDFFEDYYDEPEVFDKPEPAIDESTGYLTERLSELRPLNEYHLSESVYIIDTKAYSDYLLFLSQLEKIQNDFLDFMVSLMRVQNCFKPFLEKLASFGHYPNNEELAECFKEFTTGLLDYKQLISTGSSVLSHTVLQTKKAPILCKTYRFTTLGAYLYFELFNCFEEKFLPVKCKNCGRYFIMKHTTFSNFCTRKIKGSDKTCREVGFRMNYENKIKSDPVWLTYSRAYKTHYARYMKKRMTQIEFMKWADYALELRQKALDGELSFEEYYELIRK